MSAWTLIVKALVQINCVLIEIDCKALVPVQINCVRIVFDSEEMVQINCVQIDIDSKVLLNHCREGFSCTWIDTGLKDFYGVRHLLQAYYQRFRAKFFKMRYYRKYFFVSICFC